MPRDGDDRERVAAARDESRRVLGAALEQKATDEFCLAASQQRMALVPLGFGAAPARTGTMGATVVEFTDDARGSTTSLARTSAAWPQVVGAVAAVRREVGEHRLLASLLLRQAIIARVRADCYRLVGAVDDEIERLSGGLFRPEPATLGAPPLPRFLTEVCWLNRTLRAWADPRALAEVAADPSVVRIDVPRRLLSDAAPSIDAIGVPTFRAEHGVTGAGVTIAVIDSEVARTHPALAERVVHCRNDTVEPWGNPGAHGTAVAGIIAARDPNYGGVAPEASIYNYKVLATNRVANADDFAGALALQHALEDGCDIANCSWGAGPADHGDSREARAVDTAWALGMVVVKSAGNNGPGAGTLTSPGDADGVIVVGATDALGTTVQDYSSRGPAPNGAAPRPHLVAPGGGADGAIMGCLPNGGFGNAGHGTSYAAPHVSGLAALLLELEPDLSTDEVRDRLTARAAPLPGFSDHDQGEGLARL